MAQVIGAILGLVFWVLAARLVDAHEVGVAAAAISAQTLLGIVTVLGIGTVLISDLPLHEPRRQRQLVMRGLLVVLVSSALVGGALVALSPLFTANLKEALGDPVGATAFVVGVVAAAWAIVADEAALGLKRSTGPGAPQPARVQPPVPDHGRPARPRPHRRARPPGVLGAPAGAVRAVRAVAAPAAEARPEDGPGPVAALRRGHLPWTRPA